MNRQEATFQHENDEPLLNCESKRKTVGQITTSTSELNGKQTQDEILDSKSIKEEKVDIKIEPKDVPYTGEPFVKSEFVLLEENGMGENKEVSHTNELYGKQNEDEMFDYKSVKEETVDIKIELEDVPYTGEPFVQLHFVLPEEIGIKGEDKEMDYTESSAVASKVIHKPSKARVRRYVLANIECLHCPYKTNDTREFYIHKVAHIPKETAALYRCFECSFSSNRLDSVNKHYSSAHKKTDVTTLHQCSECSFRSRWLQSVKKHYLSKHKITWYHCPNCPYKTKRLKNLTHFHILFHRKERS